MASSSTMRMPIASTSPICRALARCSSGSFPTTIVRKTILSIPSTISSAVSVNNAMPFSTVSSSTI